MVPKKFIHFSYLFLFLTALTGVWMRLFPFSTTVHRVNYDHILHAHSHIAILGWTFLAVVIIYIHMMWQHISQKREAKWIIVTTVIFSLMMFFAFLYEGYAKYSIILSVIHIFIEYWVVLFIFKTLKDHITVPPISKLFLKAGAIMLVISSIGPFALGAISSMGLRTSPLFDMAIYFYLHFQYNGWLYLMLIGLFIIFLHSRNIALQPKWLTYSFYVYTIALFPGFLLSILWYDLGWMSLLLGVIGGAGQFIGVIFLLIAVWQVYQLMRESFDSLFIHLITFAFVILFAKAFMELGLTIPSLAMIVYDTRHVVIGYLHLTLLGFVTLFIFSLFHVTQLVQVNRQIYQFGIYTFIIGFCLNEFVLFSAALLEWLNLGSFPLQNSLLLIASITMLISICFIWLPTRTKDYSFAIETVTTSKKELGA